MKRIQTLLAIWLASTMPIFARIAAPSDIRTFEFVYSGAPYMNSAVIVGSLTWDVSAAVPINLWYSLPNAAFSDITMSVSGGTSGNGTFLPTEFDSIRFNLFGPLDLTTELVGQPNFTSFDFSSFFGSVAPDYSSPNELQLNGGLSDRVRLISFRPAGNKALLSAQTSGLAFGNATGQGLLAGSGAVLGDVNNRLFGLRSSDGDEPSGIGTYLDFGVIPGEGDGKEGPAAQVAPASRQWQVFTTVNYGNVNVSTIGAQNGVQIDSWAPGVGVERRLGGGFTLGLAASFLTSEQNYANNLGSLDLEGPALSAYLSYVRSGLWTDLLYSFGAYDISTLRNPGLGFPVATGHTTARTHAIQYNVGWNFRFQDNTLVTGPFAGIDYLHGRIDSYTEGGGGLAALAYGKQTVESLATRVGWSVSKKVRTGLCLVTPQFTLAYERQNIDNNNGTSVQLINAPGGAAGGNQSPGQSYLVLGAGVNFQITDQFNMLLSYQGQYFRENLDAHFGGVRFSYAF